MADAVVIAILHCRSRPTRMSCTACWMTPSQGSVLQQARASRCVDEWYRRHQCTSQLMRLPATDSWAS
jgi:hypothetical protein